jgi:putative MATE family efflux protein
MMNASLKGRPGSWAVFLSYALPAVAGTLLATGATVVDGIFVGRCIGPEALAAVNLTLPVLYVFLALAVMIAVGGASLAARLAGGGAREDASRIFSASLALLALASVAVAVLASIFMEPLLALLGANGAVLEPTRRYLAPMLWFFVLSMLNIGLTSFLRTAGRPMLPLLLGLAGSAVDIFLDWLFIPKMGMGLWGAALSSGIGAAVEALLALAIFASHRTPYSFVSPRLDKTEFASIFGNGASEFIGQLSVTLVTWLYNSVLMRRMGVTGVVAYTISGYLCFVEYMFVLGFCQGLWPLAATACGAGDRRAEVAWLRTALKAGLGVAAVMTLASLVIPGPFASLFLGLEAGAASSGSVASAGAAAATRMALVCTGLSFLPAALNMLASAYFTSVGDAKSSALISSLRGLVLIAALVLVLPLVLGDSGIWIALPAAELLTAAVSSAALGRRRRLLTFPAVPAAGVAMCETVEGNPAP